MTEKIFHFFRRRMRLSRAMKIFVFVFSCDSSCKPFLSFRNVQFLKHDSIFIGYVQRYQARCPKHKVITALVISDGALSIVSRPLLATRGSYESARRDNKEHHRCRSQDSELQQSRSPGLSCRIESIFRFVILERVF